jgi:AraC-like DNA-binding protein
MLWIDAFLRIGAITLLFMGAILVIRDRLCWRPTVFIVLAGIGVSTMLIGSAPESLGIPAAVQSTAYAFEFISIVFIWWFGLALFRDDFKLRWPHWIFFILCGALRMPHNIAEMTGSFTYPPLLDTICELIVVGMMAHLIITIIREGEDDLVLSRRRSRNYFIIGVVAAVLLSTFTEHGWIPIPQDYVYFIKSATTFPLALWFTLWLSRLDHKSLNFETEITAEPAIATEETIDPRDKELLGQLISAMETDKVYREAGLTIRDLAERLNTPEHRLRVLINQGLGYRNFSAFLNSYRIDAIKAEFADPEKARIPVLTLAMDVGYNSLAPFNRAFRTTEGMTPTAYRQQLLSK